MDAIFVCNSIDYVEIEILTRDRSVDKVTKTSA